MSKKSMLAALAAVGVMTAGASALAEDVVGAVGADVVSAYVFRGATLNDEVNVQPYLEGSAYGITVGTWANFNTDTSVFDEIDYYAGYDIPMPEDSIVGASVGYCEYTYPTGTMEAPDGTTVGLEADREISLGLSVDTILAPELGFYYGVDGGISDDLYIDAGISHEVAVNEDVTVSAGAVLGYLEPDEGKSGFSNCTLSLGATYGPATVTLNYVIETDSDVLAVDQDFYVAVGVGI